MILECCVFGSRREREDANFGIKTNRMSKKFKGSDEITLALRLPRNQEHMSAYHRNDKKNNKAINSLFKLPNVLMNLFNDISIDVQIPHGLQRKQLGRKMCQLISTQIHLT